ncbi:MAG: hypothetical protein KDJ90_09460 [Nitratireductor sp.]|nr:hypothetical protein [Nitratireductor sp.]
MRHLLGLTVLCAALFAGASESLANCAKIKPRAPGEVYFMRGLANIFSLGLDQFGKELSKLGVENCVFNHSVWQSLANDIVERSYRGEVSFPVIIIGHSLGANIAPKMATIIGRHNIPVAYVVMLDPVEPTFVGKNVEEIRNYYLPKRNDNTLHPLQDFDGDLENVNVKRFGGFDHFNIDENRQLRDLMKSRIIDIINARIAAEKK